MTGKELVSLEKKALAAVREKEYSLARELFEMIVAVSPNWEHGGAQYSLANLYEKDGDFSAAETAFLAALSIEPSNWHYLGGYAGFLKDRGRVADAFVWHRKLLRLEQQQKMKQTAQTVVALFELGSALGLSREQIQQELEVV
jgi:Tfp pilus assembly protein PilF